MSKQVIEQSEINALLKPADPESQKKQERKIRRKFWPTLKKAMAQLPLAEDVVTAYFCAMDNKTPAHVKGVLLAAFAYFILPVDLVPDFIAGIGFGDDVAVLTAAFTTLQKHMTPAQRDAAKKALGDMAQKKETESS